MGRGIVAVVRESTQKTQITKVYFLRRNVFWRFQMKKILLVSTEIWINWIDKG